MTKLLFVFHGNICRSPMAEFVMKDLVKKAGLEQAFVIESCATHTDGHLRSVFFGRSETMTIKDGKPDGGEVVDTKRKFSAEEKAYMEQYDEWKKR